MIEFIRFNILITNSILIKLSNSATIFKEVPFYEVIFLQMYHFLMI